MSIYNAEVIIQEFNSHSQFLDVNNFKSIFKKKKTQLLFRFILNYGTFFVFEKAVYKFSVLSAVRDVHHLHNGYEFSLAIKFFCMKTKNLREKIFLKKKYVA